MSNANVTEVKQHSKNWVAPELKKTSIEQITAAGPGGGTAEGKTNKS